MTGPDDQKEGFLEHIEQEVEGFLHSKDATEVEHDAEAVAPLAADAAEAVDPSVTPVIDEAETVADEVKDRLDPTIAPSAPAPPSTSDTVSDPSSEDPTSDSSETPSADSDPASPSTDSEAPVSVPVGAPAPVGRPTEVLPTDGPHDTREAQALINAGKAPGLTSKAQSAIEDLGKVIDGIDSWLIFARDAVARAKNP